MKLLFQVTVKSAVITVLMYTYRISVFNRVLQMLCTSLYYSIQYHQ